jgi:hypothetical protein
MGSGCKKLSNGQALPHCLYKELQTEMEETDMEGRVTTPWAVAPPPEQRPPWLR